MYRFILNYSWLSIIRKDTTSSPCHIKYIHIMIYCYWNSSVESPYPNSVSPVLLPQQFLMWPHLSHQQQGFQRHSVHGVQHLSHRWSLLLHLLRVLLQSRFLFATCHGSRYIKTSWIGFWYLTATAKCDTILQLAVGGWHISLWSSVQKPTLTFVSLFSGQLGLYQRLVIAIVKYVYIYIYTVYVVKKHMHTHNHSHMYNLMR